MPVIAEHFGFGPFHLDIPNSQLLLEGTPVRLRPQTFQVLRALVQNAGQWVSCEKLIEEAWDGSHVSRHTVSVTVAELKTALQDYGAWIATRPKIGYCIESPRPELKPGSDLIKMGWHFWNRRTREGFTRALECFEKAARENDSDPRAWEGIAASWLLPATYGMRPPLEVYPEYLRAYHLTVSLGGRTPDVRAMHGHALHMFERRLPQAEAELLASLREKPVAATYVRLAILYATMRRLDDALAAVNQALEADPLWPMGPATEVFIRFCRREFEEAARCVGRALELQPYLLLGRAFCAQALEYAGRTREALDQYRFARLVYPDVPWLAALEAACLARNGKRAEARAILDELRRARETLYVDAWHMALLMEALGLRAEALNELERAAAENSAALYILDVDPRMDSLRAEPRFAKVQFKLNNPC